MREIRTSGSEGGGAGKSTGPPYPYHAGAPSGHSCSAGERVGEGFRAVGEGLPIGGQALPGGYGALPVGYGVLP